MAARLGSNMIFRFEWTLSNGYLIRVDYTCADDYALYPLSSPTIVNMYAGCILNADFESQFDKYYIGLESANQVKFKIDLDRTVTTDPNSAYFDNLILNPFFEQTATFMLDSPTFFSMNFKTTGIFKIYIDKVGTGFLTYPNYIGVQKSGIGNKIIDGKIEVTTFDILRVINETFSMQYFDYLPLWRGATSMSYQQAYFDAFAVISGTSHIFGSSPSITTDGFFQSPSLNYWFVSLKNIVDYYSGVSTEILNNYLREDGNNFIMSNLMPNNTFYKQLYDGTGGLGAALATDGTEVYLCGWINYEISQATIFNNSTLGFFPFIKEKYSTFHDFAREYLTQFVSPAHVQITTYGAGKIRVIFLVTKVKEVASITIDSNLVLASPEINPVEKSLARTTGSNLEIVEKDLDKIDKPEIAQSSSTDNNIPVPIVFNNVPVASEDTTWFVGIDYLVKARYKVNPAITSAVWNTPKFHVCQLFYKETIAGITTEDVFIRVHEWMDIYLGNSLFLSNYITFSAFDYNQFGSLNNSALQLFTLLQSTKGMTHLCSQIILDIFKYDMLTEFSMDTYLENGETGLTSFWFNNQNEGITLDLNEYDVTGKNLFTTYPTIYHIIKRNIDFRHNAILKVVLLSEGE